LSSRTNSAGRSLEAKPLYAVIYLALIFPGLAVFAPRGVAQQSGEAPAQLSFASAGGANPNRADSNDADPNASDPANNSGKTSRARKPDFNRDIYYRNKFEFALDVGWLPINIPFPLDVFEGDNYNQYPLRYTLVPVVASLRWHVNGVGGPIILRGNWDVTASLSATAIPRGPETHYFSYDMGVRRNFVPRNWRVAPYWDVRLGMGLIDAKGPEGVYYAQGQDLTFTLNMGAGARYNFSPRYAVSAGLNFMHISNADLSQPKVSNYGINVYGPQVGLDIQLSRHLRQVE